MANASQPNNGSLDDSSDADFNALMSFGASQLGQESTRSNTFLPPWSTPSPNNNPRVSQESNRSNTSHPPLSTPPPNSSPRVSQGKAKWVQNGGILLIIMFLIGLAVRITDMSKSSLSVTLPECTFARRHTGIPKVVPLPLELHDFERLPIPTNIHSSVCSSVRAINRELTKGLACAMKRYSRADSHHKKARSALVNDIILAHEQTILTVSNVSLLHDLYSSIKPTYHEHNLAAAKALEAVQLDDRRAFLVSAQPLISKWAGFDYKKMYWDPWVEKGENLKKVQATIDALEKQLGRLEDIQQITQDVGHDLHHLNIALVEEDARIARDSGSLLRKGYSLITKGRERQLEGGESRENWLKNWFRQHVARYVIQDRELLMYSQFDTWWIDLDCWCSG